MASRSRDAYEKWIENKELTRKKFRGFSREMIDDYSLQSLPPLFKDDQYSRLKGIYKGRCLYYELKGDMDKKTMMSILEKMHCQIIPQDKSEKLFAVCLEECEFFLDFTENKPILGVTIYQVQEEVASFLEEFYRNQKHLLEDKSRG